MAPRVDLLLIEMREYTGGDRKKVRLEDIK